MTNDDGVLEIVGASYHGDTREPHGTCRWCGTDNGDGQGFALIREHDREWYECGACCWAIAEYGLQSDDPDGYDVAAILTWREHAPGTEECT